MEQSVTNPAESATEQNGPLIFGNYEAVKAIGKGKFAIVYRAHRIGDDQIVALKRISVDMMNDKAREKCLKEVRLLQSLDHPNIIHYMDSFITDNDLIIIYEWAAAGDLKRQIRKAQEKGVGFEERVIWKYFSQIANAIQHMHERRIMHRDLKPANIFLTLDGTIKVGDLGLSREFSEHTHQAHSKVGTPLYMSPEVIKGDGYEFKSDIWSLGCLLYELAVLKSPFKAEGINLYSLLHKISNGDYQPIPDHYSDELRNLAHAMISTNPEDRPDINYICEMAQRMRAQTAEKAGRLKRSYSRSEDLTDGVAEIKNDNRTAEIQGLVPSDSKPTFAENETKPPQRQRAPTDEFKLERRDSERSRIETREKERFEEQTFAVNNAQQFQVVIPFDDDPNYGKKSSKETSSEPAVYRRSKPPLPDTSKSGRPSSRVSRPSTVDDAPLKETNTNNFEEDFNSQGMPRKPSSSNLAAALENSSQAFAAMDVLYGKLVVLGYPMNDRKIALSSIPSSQRAKGRLLPIHFACNLQAFERIAGHEPNYQFVQFRRMAEVVIWLCQEKIGGKAADIANKIDTETSNSVTIAKQIVMAAQAAGSLSEEVAAVTPTSLIQGYGYNVCILLGHLADCALKAINFSPPTMIYPASFDEAPASGDIQEDSVDQSSDDGPDDAVNSVENNQEVKEEDSELAFSVSTSHPRGGRFHFPDITQIDPILWKEETERVIPMLKKAEKAIGNSYQNSWQAHLSLIENYNRQVVVPSRKDPPPPISSPAAPHKDGLRLPEVLQTFKSLIQSQNQQLTNAERLLNNRAEYESLLLQYRSHKTVLDEYQQKVQALTERNQVLASEAAEKDDQLEEAKQVLRDRVSGDPQEGADGLNPVVRYKEAIQRLQSEIQEMFVTSNFLSHQLLHLRQRSVNQRQQKLKKYKKRRRGRHRRLGSADHESSGELTD